MIEQRLGALLDNKQKIFKSMLYSSVGGKYKRGVIFLYLSEVLGAKISSVLDIACAIEILHGYSLIHDDLPALDNAELRRGKASCHKAFGEATAILAGDGLLTYAFEVIANAEILPSATSRP
jgi:geranylgeranyl pyrophosphate synthase